MAEAAAVQAECVLLLQKLFKSQAEFHIQLQLEMEASQTIVQELVILRDPVMAFKGEIQFFPEI
jgi:hypothetical protein|tara:strand:+ start:75 stop:266 length:192 start_codon:yes stop_codon:yes gene_type:complete